ncbi:hypothetical protein RclHR1_03240007 [Rhizophagus clarus]|uniref:Uncharacterized protein n=1 Tax=Rhizophagus clarus TaxID=94130 RepID=A0A2Z6RBU5_9GLOM|nr:hypothetical protein RclHR1_03240007 [Rhizophagus clarus]GES74863.1 hypothetical protein GLOIN_2v1478934 [Rhizophagus clarus]
MSKSDKILTPEYLNWHVKLSGLSSVLTDKIQSNLYKKYKKETGHEPWQLSEDCLLINSKPENKVSYLPSSEQCGEKVPITFEVRSDPELIIKSVLEHFPYLKFENNFRGIDNYDFTSPQPWSSLCPICDGKHGNYGLHDKWYCENGNQLPYDPFLVQGLRENIFLGKFQLGDPTKNNIFLSNLMRKKGDKLEYCFTCNISSNKLKFVIMA